MGEVQDYIVVGSGCTGAMAAQTLVEAGASVTMLDVGNTDSKYAGLVPAKDFIDIRRGEADQHRYFLGDDFEGAPGTSTPAGAQLTPPRKYILAQTQKYLGVKSSNFHALESLAYGGLGSSWGAGCCVFSGPELARAGLDPQAMPEAYKVVCGRIGISGARDDAGPYTLGDLDNFLPALEIDANCRRLYDEYSKRRDALNRQGFHMGRPALAVLSRNVGDRRGLAYREMDFYSDLDRSTYRPWITVDRLKQATNFRYADGILVLRFHEDGGGVLVSGLDTRTDRPMEIRCRRLLLAPGVLGTARIVLRSLGAKGQRLSLLTNHYGLFPCVQWRMLGSDVESAKSSFAQLSMFYDEDGSGTDSAMALLYSYRALMLFRIAGQMPFNLQDSRVLLNYLLPALVIMGIHHPESPAGGTKCLSIVDDPGSATGDRLCIDYRPAPAELRVIAERERKYLRVMRSLGCHALGRIDPGPGSSIHYAGTLPFGDTNGPIALRSDGKLSGTQNVFVADGSGFRSLPAKGLTLSLMANAHLVAKNALSSSG